MNKELLQAAKDQAAREAGYENYSHMIKTLGHHRIGETTDTVFDYVMNRAMEIYASQQRTEGIREGFEAARERRYLSPYNKYNTVEDYLNSK